MNELQFVRRSLERTRRADLAAVETGCGVPFDTLIKIKYGTTANPRFETVRKLSAYFRRRQCVRSNANVTEAKRALIAQT